MAETGKLAAVSFTAARNFGNSSCEAAVSVLVQVPLAVRYVTGGCTGGDAFIGRWLAARCPAAEHVIIVPADRSQVDQWWDDPVLVHQAGKAGGSITVHQMPDGTSYEDRNAELVARGTAVFGFPAYPEDDPRSKRSGTWQAIRMARRAGNLCRWDCVQPPYHGKIERWPSTFATVGPALCRRSRPAASTRRCRRAARCTAR